MFWFVLDYDVLSKVSDRCHLSELHIPGLCCPQQRLRNSTPGAKGMALYVNVREGFNCFRQKKLECSSHEPCVFCICTRINNFYVYTFYCNPWHDGPLYDCLHDSIVIVQSVDDKAVFVFVGDASPTDRHGKDARDFCNLSGCERLVHCPTHIW